MCLHLKKLRGENKMILNFKEKEVIKYIDSVGGKVEAHKITYHCFSGSREWAERIIDSLKAKQLIKGFWEIELTEEAYNYLL